MWRGRAVLNSALVHYWLVGRRGGEVVLEALAEGLGKPDLITNVLRAEALFGALSDLKVRTTFINRLPFSKEAYQSYLLAMPLALEMMDMSPYDLIVSSEAGPAKWVIPNPDAYHICYCHSPLRYIWDQREIYLAQLNPILRPFVQLASSRVRQSDVISSVRVDKFVANSSFVAARIWKYYRREADVIHPPVRVSEYITASPNDFYLIAGEARAYKRIDLAIRACSEMGRRLIVVGAGSDSRAFRHMAGPSVSFLGKVTSARFKELLASCRALLFPGVEDFGIVPVEAMASGRPIIAQGRGGVMDSVVHGVTGLLYKGDTPEDLRAAILMFESEEDGFRPLDCINQARKFDRTLFLSKFAEVITSRT